MELADWDLHAVVRSCYTSTSSTATTATTTSTLTSPPTSIDTDFINRIPSTTDLRTHRNQPTLPPPPQSTQPDFAFTARSSFPSFTRGDLQDLCNPFMSNLHFPSSSVVSPSSTAPSPNIPSPTPLPLPSFRPLGGGGMIAPDPAKPQRQQQVAFQRHQEQLQHPPKRARFVFGTTPTPSVTKTAVVAVASSPDSASAFSISNITPPSQSHHRHSGSVFCSPASGTSTSTSQSQPKTKKRKNLQKKVFHVSAEGLSSDMWAWRKYGQKPIKGSPYPRGYYRCSSSKGCLARKQVERNRSDPKMFIVTYTAEHNHPMPTHRNSLAGSTRQKPTSSADGAAGVGSPSINSTGLDQPGCSSSPTARLSLSPHTNMAETKPKREPQQFDEEDDEEDLLMKEMNSGGEMGFSSDAVLGDDDDFFAGFGDLVDDDDALLHGGGDGDGFAATSAADRFGRSGSVELELPWLVNGGGVGGGCSGQPLVADGS